MCYNNSNCRKSLSALSLSMERISLLMEKASEIAASLLSWYDRCARSMPWRGINNPYYTWVSEAMLQQTRVETVLFYYDRFIARFPAISDLAAADESDVLKMWEGLGYYSRARNLHRGARQVMEEYEGILPRNPDLLRKIHGIGPYTAGAIASIAYQVPVPAVDGNVIRVLSRLYGIRESVQQPSVRKNLDLLAAGLVPLDRPGDYNQAVMDLGATVCVSGTPDCGRCPLSSFCDAFACGDASDLPVLPKSKPPKTEYWTVPVIRCRESLLLRLRKETLLQGLWCFPMLSCQAEEATTYLEKKTGLVCHPSGSAAPARHVFTHRIWEMTVLPLLTEDQLPMPGEERWIPYRELSSLAFPTAMNKALLVAAQLFGVEKSFPAGKL